ncbi:MAG: helix-turn-helix domain-containing protein [Ketobacteraceae bacterium]|nr:helix-turn-helix domain-containing protein [Ketobacteraceae bacterium]
MTNQEDYSLLYLWDKRTLYLGNLLGRVTLTPVTASLLVGLEGTFEFRSSSRGRVTTAVALIPAGETLSMDHGNQLVACSHLDPISNDFALLRNLMSNRSGNLYYDSPMLSQMQQCCTDIYRSRKDAETAYRQFLDEVFPEPPMVTGTTRHFHAIKKAVAIIRSRPADNLSNTDLAASVGLSSSQLQRQFKAATGVPVRRYRLWYRLFVTAAFMGQGMSLTEASLEAGFSDASHFNHTFKSMLGVKPSYILKRRDQIRILLGNRCGTKVTGHLAAVGSPA